MFIFVYFARCCQEDSEIAIAIAFDDVCKEIDIDIIQHKTMMKLTDLCKIYIDSLQLTEFPNPNFRGENLKVKLESHKTYKDRLAFCMLKSTGNFQTYIVYSSDIDVNNAVRCAYELASTDMLKEAGIICTKLFWTALLNVMKSNGPHQLKI